MLNVPDKGYFENSVVCTNLYIHVCIFSKFSAISWMIDLMDKQKVGQW